jgi:C4-dicarboxylate transporter, DctM subunit
MFLVILLAIFFVIGSPLFAVMLFISALGGLDSARPFDHEFGGFVYEFYSLGTGDKATIFSSIPLFIYAGYIMAASKTADRLVAFANAALGWVPGGLGIVTILACSVYTTFTGASGVTIVALGGLLMPALIKQRYPERFSLGLVTGTGSVGLLFPPALPIILFGTIYGLQRITQKPEHWEWSFETERFLFAGILPGILLVAMLSALVIVIAIIKKVPRQKFDIKEVMRTLPGALPVILLPLLILLGIAKGIGDISQIASLTVLYLLIVEMGIYRDLKPQMLWAITKESMALIGAIFIIIYSATAVTNYLVTEDVPGTLVAWTTAHIHERWMFLLALNVLLLLAGMVMDIFSAILIIVPLIAPVAFEYDISPYHLGVIFLLNLEIGYLHPPIGLNLFISSFKFRKPLLEVTIATLPFMLVVLASLMIVTYVPGLTVVPPPTPRGNMDNLVQLVRSSEQAAVNVNEVTFPNGKKMTQQDCFKIVEDNERESCMSVFTKVTDCALDNEDDPDEAKTCQKEVIQDWYEASYKEEAGLRGLLKKASEGFPKPVIDDTGDGGFEDEGDVGEGGFEGAADDEGSGDGSGSAEEKGDSGEGGFEALGGDDEPVADKKKDDGNGAGGFEELGEDEDVDAAPK